MISPLRVCLVNPIGVSSYPPLNLATIAGYLQRYCTRPLDLRIFDLNFDKDLSGSLVRFAPHIAGFTSLSPSILDAINLGRELKRAVPGVITVCGGIHATVAPEDPLGNGFDLAVIGEGEQTFLEVVEAYSANGGSLTASALASIRGLALMRDGSVVRTPPREVIDDLDTIPHPARHLLNKKYSDSFYITRGASSRGLHTIHGSRACPFNCIFCCVNFTVKSKTRFHSPEYIVEEMEKLVSDFGARWIFFTDDTFFVRKEHTRSLCELMIQRGIPRKLKWEVQIRSNLVREKDLGLLKLMRTAGCRQVDIGFESFNPRMLKYIKGGNSTPADHDRAIKLINLANIHVLGTVIVGTPTETYEEMMETVRAVNGYSRAGQLQYFQVGHMQAYPGTRVYQVAEQLGILKKNYLESLKTPGQANHTLIVSDKVPAETVTRIVSDLNRLSIRAIPLAQKLRWVLSNLWFSPRQLLRGGVLYFRLFLDRLGERGAR